MPDYQKTVDLKEKMTPRNRQAQNGRSFEIARQKVLAKKPVSAKKAEGIDEVFSDELKTEKIKNFMHRIERPTKNESDDGFYKKISIILLFVLFSVVIYFVFFSKSKTDNKTVSQNSVPGWYSVKLMNNETYYGEIKDVSTDPVVIENVYYNYDQINAEKAGEKLPESANLRLVKRGKETHGPDGTMSVVRAQIVFMEALKEDSKVLKAILDYEK